MFRALAEDLIATVVLRGLSFYVYDEKGRQLFAIPSGNTNSQKDLVGYTGHTVTVKRGYLIYTYNDKGQQIGVTSSYERS